MEDYRSNLMSPTSIRRSITKKRSQSDLMQKMRFLRGKENEETPKKPIQRKHFMSPTFSASSKARKKLSLMDKNEQEEEEEYTFSASSKSRKNVIVEKHQDYTVSIYTCETNLPPDSKPYDPFTNYLTPRPKFLMYNPDKQRQEMGLSESSECSSPLSPPRNDFIIEDGMESTDFEDEEEIEEEKQGMLYKVMKLLFVLCAIVLSTFYISSMNSPKTGHLLALRDSANDFAFGSVFLNQTLAKDSSFREAQIHLSDEGAVGTEGLDLLQVFVNENVVGRVLEDSSKFSDSLDLDEKGEIMAGTLRIPDVSVIHGLPILMESADEVRFDENVTACEGTGEKEMVSEHQMETVVEKRTNLWDAEIVETGSSESAKIEAFSHVIDMRRIILGDILSTCEVVDSARGHGDDQTMRTEEFVTDMVLAMGGIASLVGGIAVLAVTLRLVWRRLVWRMFTKPSARLCPSPVTQECVEPVLVEDSRAFLLAKKDDGTTVEKEQFAVEQRLIELCYFQAPTVELLGEYVVSPEFSRASLKKCTRGSSPVEAQQAKQDMFPDSSSGSASCSNTTLDSNLRFGREKIVKEEEGSTAALRRSTRLRHKTFFFSIVACL